MFNNLCFYIIINHRGAVMNKKAIKAMAIFLALIMVLSSIAGIVALFVR